MWKRLARWLPAVGWYGVIWGFSSQTGSESQAMSDGVLEAMGYDIQNSLMTVSGVLSVLVRKGAHMFAFFVLTGALAFALRRLVKRPVLRGAAALALCAVLAGLDEFHQTFIPGRSGLPTDVLVDLAGGVCFLLLWALARFVWARRHGDRPRQNKEILRTGA